MIYKQNANTLNNYLCFIYFFVSKLFFLKKLFPSDFLKSKIHNICLMIFVAGGTSSTSSKDIARRRS